MRINIQIFYVQTNITSMVSLFCIHKITRNPLWKYIQCILEILMYSWVLRFHCSWVYFSKNIAKMYFCPYDTMVKIPCSVSSESWKISKSLLVTMSKVTMKLHNVQFSAVSQIWKKYIQKRNAWDLPLIFLWSLRWVFRFKVKHMFFFFGYGKTESSWI